MNQFKAPDPVYLGPPAHHSGTGNKPILRVVIHSTVSPCERGGARDIAAYFRSPRAGGSAHYVTDPGETVQAAFDSYVCWHAPPNPHTVGIEMCDMPGPVPATAKARREGRKVWRWNDKNHKAMLKRTATLTAELCLAYGIPVRFLTEATLRREGRAARGITTHANTSKAFRESTHWDPGFWPRVEFMKLVRAEVRRLKKEARK